MSTRLAGSRFLAPTVSTLTKLDNAARARNMVAASDGTFTLPSPEELAAAAELAAAPNPDAGAPALPYLGCFSGQGLLMAGTVVGSVAGAADAGACCRACRAHATCNVWALCPDPAGCK